MQLETQKNHNKHLLTKSVRNKRGGWKIVQILINGVSGISMSRMEFFLGINKRPGPFIMDSRVFPFLFKGKDAQLVKICVKPVKTFWVRKTKQEEKSSEKRLNFRKLGFNLRSRLTNQHETFKILPAAANITGILKLYCVSAYVLKSFSFILFSKKTQFYKVSQISTSGWGLQEGAKKCQNLSLTQHVFQKNMASIEFQDIRKSFCHVCLNPSNIDLAIIEYLGYKTTPSTLMRSSNFHARPAEIRVHLLLYLLMSL